MIFMIQLLETSRRLLGVLQPQRPFRHCLINNYLRLYLLRQILLLPTGLSRPPRLLGQCLSWCSFQVWINRYLSKPTRSITLGYQSIDPLCAETNPLESQFLVKHLDIYFPPRSDPLSLSHGLNGPTSRLIVGVPEEGSIKGAAQASMQARHIHRA